MKKLVFLFVCALMATLAIAQESATKALTANNVVSATSSFEATKGTENFINFEVEAMEAGDYYAEFWLLPAEYADGSFTTFKVYVNFKYVGSITTDKGNWQAATVDDLPALKLNSGKNYVSVSTEAPECPQVETVRLSKSAQAAKISSAEYDAYLEKAINSDGTPEAVESITPMSTSDISDAEIIPLGYSFFKTIQFEKGQEIFITSSSDIAHDIDLFIVMVKEDQPITVMPQSLDLSLPSGFEIYRFANSDEMQGINWVGMSEKSVNDPNAYIATIRATIPKTGTYMVKLRSAENLVAGAADLNINGTYFYENAPMFYSAIECTMPADGNYYASFAKSYIANGNEGVDPMLFIVTKAGDRVVGYNNNCMPQYSRFITFYYVQSYWDLTYKDSFISQIYNFPTNSLHVSNYNSLTAPLSTKCYVKGGIHQGFGSVVTPAQAPARDRSETTAKSGLDNNISITQSSPDIFTPITISAKEKINKVEAYTLSGTKTKEQVVNDYSTTILPQELGINSNGIYILSVETESAKKTHKISIR